MALMLFWSCETQSKASQGTNNVQSEAFMAMVTHTEHLCNVQVVSWAISEFINMKRCLNPVKKYCILKVENTVLSEKHLVDEELIFQLKNKHKYFI